MLCRFIIARRIPACQAPEKKSSASANAKKDPSPQIIKFTIGFSKTVDTGGGSVIKWKKVSGQEHTITKEFSMQYRKIDKLGIEVSAFGVAACASP